MAYTGNFLKCKVNDMKSNFIIYQEVRVWVISTEQSILLLEDAFLCFFLLKYNCFTMVC